ncbi:MAG: DNA primase [Planctomycetia bacterium]|nr:MAG: DNA primase [Planctomycetia bacterium]
MHNSLKDSILEAIDIVDVIGERVSLVRKGKDFVGLCPFHPDHTPSMSVSPKKRIFKCWSCGAGGDVIKFVQMRERVEFPEALAILARRAGIELRPGSVSSANSAARDAVRTVIDWAVEHFARNLQSPEGRSGAEYARRRGLSEDLIATERLGYAPDSWNDLVRAAARVGVSEDSLEQAGLATRGEKGTLYDRFRDRLIFPIRDSFGRPIAFGGRALGADPAKYLNSPESPVFSKSRVLYGLSAARDAIEKQRSVVIVEGYLDALLLRQHGFANVVATLGTALTDAHVKLLLPVADRLIFCFDSDAAGVKAADRAVETALRHRTEVRVVALQGGKDPADLVVSEGGAAFSQQLQSAVDALEFKWRQMLTGFDGASTQARRSASAAFVDFVAASTSAGSIDPLDQGMLVGRLAELLSLPVGTVHDLLARARQRRPVAASPPAAERVADERSAYDSQTRNLPPGLVGAVEELLGLMIQEPGAFGWQDDAFAEAVALCPAWSALESAAHELFESDGPFRREEFLERCDDPLLLELVARVSRYGALPSDAAMAFDACRSRLVTELDALQMDEVRGRLQGVSSVCESGERDFLTALDAARRQQGFRWHASGGAVG